MIWDAETGGLLGELVGPIDAYGPEWSPRGSRLLVSTQSGVRIWDTTTLEETMRYPAKDVAWGSWSPDGTAMAITVWNGDLKVFPAWESLEQLVAHAKDCCVHRALTPDERLTYGLSETPAR